MSKELTKRKARTIARFYKETFDSMNEAFHGMQSAISIDSANFYNAQAVRLNEQVRTMRMMLNEFGYVVTVDEDGDPSLVHHDDVPVSEWTEMVSEFYENFIVKEVEAVKA